MKFLISQLYLLALFALPFVSTSCSDDDDNSTKVEISSLGVVFTIGYYSIVCK